MVKKKKKVYVVQKQTRWSLVTLVMLKMGRFLVAQAVISH